MTTKSTTVTAAVLMVAILLTFCGYAFHIFSSDWYRTTDWFHWALSTLGIILQTLPNLFQCNPFLAFVFSVLAVLVLVKRPREKFNNSLILISGLIPGSLIPFWGAYWYLKSTEGPIPESKVLIASEGLEVLMQLACAFLFLLFVWVLISKQWRDNRVFAVSILLMQLIFFKAGVCIGYNSLDYVIFGI